MTYPAFVTFISILVVIIMLWKVVPTFAQMFTAMDSELPAATQAILNLSEWFKRYYYLVFLALIATPLVIFRYYKSEKGRYQMDKLFLKLPVMGDIIRKSSVARFTRTLGTLLNAGIPIIEALRITSKTAGNKVLEYGIIKALESISGGQTVAEPLSETEIFPPMVIQMIAIGEKTGNLAEMLDKVSDFYNDEVDSAVDNLTSLIEPAVIVGLGAIIGVILVAMYLPMFTMAASIG